MEDLAGKWDRELHVLIAQSADRLCSLLSKVAFCLPCKAYNFIGFFFFLDMLYVGHPSNSFILVRKYRNWCFGGKSHITGDTVPLWIIILLKTKVVKLQNFVF